MLFVFTGRLDLAEHWIARGQVSSAKIIMFV